MARLFLSMSGKESQLDELIRRGAAELAARAVNARSIQAATLEARVRAVVEKYLLRDDERASGAKIKKFIDELHADDLCLVIACERGDEAAWNELVERFGVTVRAAARAASANAEAAEELAQSIWAELYGWRSRAGGGKLAYYSGRGSLGGWLRAVTGQLAVDRHRQNARFVQMESEAEADRMEFERPDQKVAANSGVAVRNPETALADRQSAAALHDALAKTIAALGPDDRLLIKLYYFDDLRLREIGALLGFHEATASRRLSHLQQNLKRGVQRILVDEHGWTVAEAERSLSETAAHLDVDLSRLLEKPNEAASTHEAIHAEDGLAGNTDGRQKRQPSRTRG